MTLNDKIRNLENKIRQLEAKVKDLSRNTEQTLKKPYTISGGVRDRTLTRSIDIGTGLSQMLGNGIIWNDTELEIPRIDEEPSEPTKGYNKHSHSRYSGGALISDSLEIVEYDWGDITNKHSQQYWSEEPQIATEANSAGEMVEKIGNLDLTFNPDTQKWSVSSLEIDIERCYLVKRRTTPNINEITGEVIEGEDVGDIELDENGNEMKAPLYITDEEGNIDVTKSCVVWDENAQCFRFYAAYAPEPEVEEEE